VQLSPMTQAHLLEDGLQDLLRQCRGEGHLCIMHPGGADALTEMLVRTRSLERGRRERESISWPAAAAVH